MESENVYFMNLFLSKKTVCGRFFVGDVDVCFVVLCRSRPSRPGIGKFACERLGMHPVNVLLLSKTE